MPCKRCFVIATGFRNSQVKCVYTTLECTWNSIDKNFFINWNAYNRGLEQTCVWTLSPRIVVGDNCDVVLYDVCFGVVNAARLRVHNKFVEPLILLETKSATFCTYRK